jgi:hypothetical protein
LIGESLSIASGGVVLSLPF